MIRIVFTFGFAYVLIISTLFTFQRRLIYVPDRERPTPAAFGVPEMAEIGLETADRVKLLAWWRAPVDATAPVIVYFHGNAGHLGFRADKVRPYLDAGYGVLLPAWRGYSGNDGSPSEAGLYLDARAAIAFLTARGFDAARIVVYGESLGTGPAVQIATEITPAALVLEAPFTALADVVAAMPAYRVVPVRLLLRDRFNNLAKIGRVRAPLLIVHGERDTLIPVALGRRLLEAANPPKEGVFPAAAGHADLYDYGAAAAILDFIGRVTGYTPQRKLK
jgi:uncharacterized protein